VEQEAATTKMLENRNDGLRALKPTIQNPDVGGGLELYGSAFGPEDLPDIPPDDLPPGCPHGCAPKRAGQTGKARPCWTNATPL